MLMQAEEVGLISLADMYLYFFKKDHAFRYALLDTRAEELDADTKDFKPLWAPNNASPDDAWGLKGMGLFSLASIHFWRHDIPFEYLDVGANMGATSIAQAIFFKRCGKNCRVTAFEPGEIFQLLQKSVSVNRLEGEIVCSPLAASDTNEQVTFYLTPKQSPAGSLIKAAVDRPEVEETRAITVQTVILDDYLAPLSEGIGVLIKIDTEGADFKVLSGLARTMKNRLCVLQIEFFPSLMGYTDPAQRLRDLTDDFHLIDIGEDANRLLDVDRIDAMMERISSLPMPMTDIYMISKSIPESEVLRDRILAG